MCRNIAQSCALCIVWLLSANSVSAQIIAEPIAGIEVDAEGVLRMRTFGDPSGELNRQRLAQMKAALDPQISQPTALRKISLTRLQAAVAEAVRTGAGLTDEMRYLGGLTRLRYVFLYPEIGEVIIAGPAEGYGLDLAGRAIGLTTGQSVLQLEDLIVALRCFPPAGRPTPLISCSIDPTADGLQRMQQFLTAIRGNIRPSDDRRIAQGLKDSLGKQIVTIEGVSPRTHFAQVLVEADYRMKLIGIGLEQPPVRIKSFVQRANPSDVARNALQRWYFVPDYDAVRVSDDHLGMELVGQGVKLISEDERVTTQGTRQQATRKNRASQAFAHSFTVHFAELARQAPVFGELRNLIDMAIAAAFMQQHDAYGTVDWQLNVFLDEQALPVENYQPPRQVESAVNVVWKGRTLMTPIGGGVNIQAARAVSAGNLQSDDRGAVKDARANLPSTTLPDGVWWWD